MVYVNNKKFACESCIKGHRSSSCHHTERPLFEIKKKGRPVSQCPKCRELRQSKKVHSKCTCDPSIDKSRQEQLVPLSATSKSKRYIPIVPSLPNGLKDLVPIAETSSASADSRQRVNTLLNPCSCSDVRNCSCLSASTSASGSNSNALGTSHSLSLEALAHAAAMQSTDDRAPLRPAASTQNSKVARARPPSPLQSSRKRSKRSSPPPQPTPGPSLAPIRFNTPSYPSYPAQPYPEFQRMPPMSQIVSLAGTGCTCGVECACPGCVEHRGPENVSQDHRDCANGCGSCVDHSIRDLPLNSGGSTAAASDNVAAARAATAATTRSFLDQFFARAAALPPPPMYRPSGPFGTTPTSGGYRALGSAQAPVTLPKLDDCCGGRCLCPGNTCSCGSGCSGACLDHQFLSQRPTEPVSQPARTSTSPPAPLRSCCAGKKAAAAEVAVSA